MLDAVEVQEQGLTLFGTQYIYICLQEAVARSFYSVYEE